MEEIVHGQKQKVGLSIKDVYDRFMKRPAAAYWSFANTKTDPEHVTSDVREFYAEGYSVFHGDNEDAQAQLLCDAPELYQLLENEAIRDVRRIQELEFPVFAAGIKPVDSRGRGRVVAYNVPVRCGGVLVTPGDLVVGDLDGIVTIPAAMVEQVVRLATDKVSRENHSRDELQKGAYLRSVYDKYGVL